jgi:hypothetical protein
MAKIRLGIDLDHVIRNINRQIVKYYQRDIDESIDIDEVDLKDDVLGKVCHFQTKRERNRFLYEDYPLEIFGQAPQIDKNLSRDINAWIMDLTNQEKYDIELFFFSMKEYDLTIQSSYFFLSKIGTRVRKVYFPITVDDLMSYGDVFITANKDIARAAKGEDKGVVFITTNFNREGEQFSDWTLDSLRDFLDCDEKNTKLSEITNKEK